MNLLKSIFTIFLISTFSFTIAQKPEVREEITSFDKITANSLVVTIPEASVEVVEKEWKSLLKVYGGKPKSSKEIITAENVVINTIGAEHLTVTSKILPQGEAVKMSVAFSTKGFSISSANNPSQYSAAENLLSGFAIRMAKKGVEMRRSDSQNELSGLEKQRNNLDMKQKQLQRDIERWEENIKKAHKEIEENKKEIENLDNSIKVKNEQINKIKDRESEINKME